MLCGGWWRRGTFPVLIPTVMTHKKIACKREIASDCYNSVEERKEYVSYTIMVANARIIAAFLLAFASPSLAFTTSSAPTQKTQLQPDADEGYIKNRRSFLTNVVATTVLPALVLSSPSSASAFGGFKSDEKGLLVYGDDSLMSQKEHGTTASAVQADLRYGVSNKLADKISSFNRRFAEMGGYFEGKWVH